MLNDAIIDINAAAMLASMGADTLGGYNRVQANLAKAKQLYKAGLISAAEAKQMAGR